jgi:hypothetical protein
VTAAVNYGLDRVRFPTPLPSGTKVRTTGHLAAAAPLAGGVRVDIRMTLETESSTKPGVRCRSSGPAARLRGHGLDRGTRPEAANPTTLRDIEAG